MFRAGFAAVLLFLFLLLTTKGQNRVVTAILFTAIALAIYIPAGYYVETFLWKRRMRNRAARK